MDLPKQGTSMAPMVTKVNPADFLVNKKIRYEAKLKDEKVIVPPKEFQAWRSRLDTLKQVVRVNNPKEITIHQSQFIMSKRRAQTQDTRQQVTNIKSHAINLDEQSEDGEIRDINLNNHQDNIYDTDVFQTEQDDDADQDAIIMEVTEREQDTVQSGSKQEFQFSQQVDQSKLVSEESCLGYLYPKRIDKSQIQAGTAYGSKLGPLPVAELERQNRQKITKASNLESLLTYPKKVHSKSGALLGFSGIKYPISFVQEALDKQREDLKSASCLSRESKTGQRNRKESQLSGENLSYVDLNQINDGARNATEADQLLAHEHHIQDTEATPLFSEDTSQIKGWESGNNPISGGISRALSSVVQTTRVGGATFVKNTAKETSALDKQMIDSDSKHNEQQEKLKLNLDKAGSGRNMSQPNLKRKKRSMNKDEQLRRKYASKPSGVQMTTESSANQTPLQLANLNVLIANLEKTGNFQQANEEAYRIRQQSKIKGSQRKTQASTSLARHKMISGFDSNKSQGGYRDLMNDTTQSFYVTDDRGNIMKVSKSTIFELNNEHQFHRMVPTLSNMMNNNSSAMAGLDQQQQQQSHIGGKVETQFRNTNSESMHQYQNYSHMPIDRQGNDTDRKTRAHLHSRSPENTNMFLDKSSASQFTSFMGEAKLSGSQMAFRYSALDESRMNGAPSVQPSNKQAQQNQSLQKEDLGQFVTLKGNGSQSKPAFSTLSSNPVQVFQSPHWLMQQPPPKEPIETMMIKGGHILQQKTIAPKESSSTKRLPNNSIIDQHKRSNRDLHMIDPTLTILPNNQKQSQDAIQFSTNKQIFPPQTSHMVQFASGNDIVYGEQIKREIEEASRSVSQNSSRIQKVPVQWQVLGQNQPTLINYNEKRKDAGFITGSNGFTLQQVSRDNSGPPHTTESQRRSVSKNSAGENTNESVRSSNLPTMLKNMKTQMVHQQVRRDTMQQAQSNYGVVGRAMSPGVSQPEVKIRSRRHSKLRDQSSQHSDDRNQGSAESASRGQNSGTTASFMPAMKTTNIGFIPPGMTLMPIVIQQTSKDWKKEANDNDTDLQSPFILNSNSQEQLNTIQRKTSGNMTSQENIKLKTRHKRSNKKQKAGNRKTSKEGLMRLDEDDYNTQDVATVLGESSANMLGLSKLIVDSKSRDLIQRVGETQKLDQASSNGNVMDLNGNIIDLSQNTKSHEKLMPDLLNNVRNLHPGNSFDAAAPKQSQLQRSPMINVNSTRTIDQQRQSIPISKNQDDQTTPMASHSHITIGIEGQSHQLRSIDNLKALGSQNSATRNLDVTSKTGSYPELDKTKNSQGDAKDKSDPSQPLSPGQLIFLKADSSTDLLALQMQSMSPNMLINLKTSKQIAQGMNLKKGKNIAGGRGSKSTGPSAMGIARNTGQAFKNKRSTMASVQKFVEQKAHIHKMKFNNTTISSVNIGNQTKTQYQEVDSSQQQQSPTAASGSTIPNRSFLPTMPFKQSNFAKTQKAIKLIRQGPLNRRMREKNLSGGQFMKLNDYVALHAHDQKVNSRMQLRPEEQLSVGLDSTALASESQNNYINHNGINSKGFHMTQTAKSNSAAADDIENVNHVTATSFMPIHKQQQQMQQAPFSRGNVQDYPGQQQQNISSVRSGNVSKGQTNSDDNNNDYADFANKHASVQDSRAQANSIDQTESSRERTSEPMQRSLYQDRNSTEEGGYNPSVKTPMTNNNQMFVSSQPASSKSVSRQPFNLAGQTALLSDYVHTQRVNEVTVTMETKSKSKPGSIDGKMESAEGQPMTKVSGVAGSITIKRNGGSKGSNASPHSAYSIKENDNIEITSNRNIDPTNLNSQQRHVVVHKLTMTAPQTGPRGTRKSKGSHAIISIASHPASPSGLNSSNNQDEMRIQGREFSQTELTSNQGFRVSGASNIQGAMFASRAGSKPFQMSQNRSNIINFGGAMQPSQTHLNQDQVPPTQSSMNSHTYQNLMNNTATGRLVHNAEAKARKFIERQRKRTATLGAQRHHRHIYKVDRSKNLDSSEAYLASESRSPDQQQTKYNVNFAPDQSGSSIPNIKNVKSIVSGHPPGTYASPPVVQFNGDSLYDSGLMIKSAAVNQPTQAKYLQNRKQAQMNQSHTSLGQNLNKNAAIAKGATKSKERTSDQPAGVKQEQQVSSKEKLEAQEDIIIKQQVQASVTDQLNTNMALTRINHQVLNANPSLLVNNRLPKRHSPNRNDKGGMSPSQQSAAMRNTFSDNLMLTGNNMPVVSNKEMKISDMPEAEKSSQYADYLREGTQDEIIEASTLRAKTPMPESAAGRMKQKQLQQHGGKWSMTQQRMHKQFMSDETLQITVQKSQIGGNSSIDTKTFASQPQAPSEKSPLK